MTPRRKGRSNLLSWAASQLLCLGSEEAQGDSERLLSEILGCNRHGLYLRANQVVLPLAEEKFRELIEKRKKRIPLAYLIRRAYFWNELLEVGPGCLIPRPETEKMIEVFLSNSGFRKEDAFSFLDLGCGSGAIGIALLREFSKARVTFSDISEEALEWTRKNLSRYSLEGRAQLVHADLFKEPKGVRPLLSERGLTPSAFSAILCNPPYLSASDWQTVDPEILCEPRVALDGGPDGLDFYRRIAGEAGRFLCKNGQIYFEVGITQAGRIGEMLTENGFEEIKIWKDDLGIERIAGARWTKS